MLNKSYTSAIEVLWKSYRSAMEVLIKCYSSAPVCWINHLHKDEDHVQDRVDPQQDRPTATGLRDLEEGEELQPRVDQGPEPERDGPDP